jgi:hypothetical protein
MLAAIKTPAKLKEKTDHRWRYNIINRAIRDITAQCNAVCAHKSHEKRSSGDSKSTVPIPASSQLFIIKARILFILIQ